MSHRIFSLVHIVCLSYPRGRHTVTINHFSNPEVEDSDGLKLSDEMTESLASHLSAFTRPLVQKIYGNANQDVQSFQDVLSLFTDPNAENTRRNL